jgi:hydrogenase maturation protease
MTCCQNLVVGIGSAHGDDQAGWQVIDLLARRPLASVQLRKASVPHDMLDWIEHAAALHIVDACDSVAQLQQLDVSTAQATPVMRTRSASSHQLGIDGVLALARSLGILPPRVVLWAIPGREFPPGGNLRQECAAQVEHCVDQLQRWLAAERCPSALHKAAADE